MAFFKRKINLPVQCYECRHCRYEIPYTEISCRLGYPIFRSSCIHFLKDSL